ncbi:hypothetical protein J3R82DRAFT_10578 [Butyriboletus roseoflavus]|nr:hypothetical protein J3R82DRAFT_10578 [Butyriboletus roseoflavus]
MEPPSIVVVCVGATKAYLNGPDWKQPNLCWATIILIATKIGYALHTLNKWIKKFEVDSGQRAGVLSDMMAKMKALEHENHKLWQANEILCKVSAYFAQAELDRQYKP